MAWKTLRITLSLSMILAIVVMLQAVTVANELAPLRRQPLNDPMLAATPEQRQLLKYLVSCALPADVALYADIDSQHYTFPGSLGLAPAWTERALSESEQRWVSACILARTNYFSEPVQISLRARRPVHEALETSQQERDTYPRFEGGFFGNLFAEQPVAYVCTGDRKPQEQAELISAKRVCTILSDDKTATGKALTRCGFIHVGACGDADYFTVEGATYDEIIFTYLKR